VFFWSKKTPQINTCFYQNQSCFKTCFFQGVKVFISALLPWPCLLHRPLYGFLKTLLPDKQAAMSIPYSLAHTSKKEKKKKDNGEGL